MPAANIQVSDRARNLYEQHSSKISKQTDRLFALLLLIQYAGAICLALLVSPRSYAGASSQVHLHVWAALAIGAVVVSLPVMLTLRFPGSAMTRHGIAVAQMLMSGLLIHVSGGRLETHFHVFGSLAFLAFYRDWKVLLTATIVVAIDHFVRGLLWPQSVFGVMSPGLSRALEHSAWVLFEDVFLIWSCRQSRLEMREISMRRAELELTNETIEQQIMLRTSELAASRDELRAKSERLEQTNSHLSRLRDEAEQASIAKSQFLANMSHELRTPMNAIIGYSEIIREECEETHDAELLLDVDRIHKSGMHLLGLINDILDLSKIEAGRMELCLENVNLDELLQDVVATCMPVVTKNGNSIELQVADGMGSAMLDATKMRQCIFNLLSNAAKFTSHGSIVISAMRATRGAVPAIVISVADTGIGMSADQQLRIFDAFAQAEETTTRKFGGTGLGLTITKHFCQMHGGELRVTSELGVGSTFTITIPDRQIEQATRPSPGLTAPIVYEPRGADTVLVVDDDINARDLLSRTLLKMGYQTILTDNGAEALELARHHQPTAITLDVLMNGMDGWEVIRRLKGLPETRHIPVIMISMVDNGEIGVALGAADFLTKPPARDRLAEILLPLRTDQKTFEVLLIDDDPLNRDILNRMLQKTSFEIVEAENGAVALERIDVRQPDLILLDLMMPEVDGFEFIQRLIATDRCRGVPIIVLTEKLLSHSEREFLSDKVASVHQKAGCSRGELVAEIARYSGAD